MYTICLCFFYISSVRTPRAWHGRCKGVHSFPTCFAYSYLVSVVVVLLLLVAVIVAVFVVVILVVILVDLVGVVVI